MNSHVFVFPIVISNDGTASFRTLHPGLASSPKYLPPLTPTLGWLLHHLIKRQPTKAVSPSIFSCLVVLGPKQENRPRHHQTTQCASSMGPQEDAATCVLSAADLPMEGEGKAAERQGGNGSCWLLCVLCFLCCVVLCSNIFYFLANQLVEINQYKGQMCKICSTVYKKPHSYLWDRTSHWCESCIEGTYKWSKNCTLNKSEFKLGTLPTFFDKIMCYSGDILRIARKLKHLVVNGGHGGLRQQETLTPKKLILMSVHSC